MTSLVGSSAGMRLALHLANEFRREPKAVGGLGDLAGGLRKRLALLLAQRARDRGAALVDRAAMATHISARCHTEFRPPGPRPLAAAIAS